MWEDVPAEQHESQEHVDEASVELKTQDLLLVTQVVAFEEQTLDWGLVDGTFVERWLVALLPTCVVGLWLEGAHFVLDLTVW